MTATLDPARKALREGVLLQPVPELGTLTVTGSERQTWLNGLVTCDLAPLRPLGGALPASPPAGGAYGVSVAKNGKILAEVWVVLAPDRLYLGVLRGRLGLVHETFDRHLIMEDVEIQDASAERAWLFAHGPRSAELLAAGRSAGADAALVDWTGLGGALFSMPADAAAPALAALTSAGPPGATAVADAAAWDVLRVEHNVPRFGVDFDDQSYPQEASIEGRAVSFNKGCYLGQEAVFMLQMRGHAKKRLVQLEIAGDGDVPSGAEVALPDGAVVGAITSRVQAPGGSGLVALGYVKYKHALPGQDLLVAGRAAKILRAPAAPA